jgi:hypothetical protein
MRTSALLVFTLAGTLYAGDREFETIVRHIELRYDAHRQHIPLFGLANFFVKVVRPAGASDLKLAIFEDLRRPILGDEEDFTGMVREALGSDWQPFVRVHNRRAGEWTCIYSSGWGRNWKLLIATLERKEATVIRIKLNQDAMMKWVMYPSDHCRKRWSD